MRAFWRPRYPPKDTPGTKAGADETMICGVCGSRAPLFALVDGYGYADCPQCESLAVGPDVIEAIDQGVFPRNYDDSYWNMELESARERASGPALALAAETVLYTLRPIKTFVDIGCGPGFLLDSLAKHIPSKTCFHGVEKFPPDTRTNHPNYNVGELADLPIRCDAGVCIEVLEHLTPKMVTGLADALAAKSNEGALYMFNTGLPDFVRREDPGYLDPLRRGHIVSWGEKALRSIFEPRGFRVIPSRTWAFAVEYGGQAGPDLGVRIWNSPNAELLRDPEMGEVMFLLGRESARVYA